MNIRMLIFISAIVAILSLANLYIVKRIGYLEAVPKSIMHLIWIPSAIFVIIQILGPWVYRTQDPELFWVKGLQWIAYLSLGWFATLFMFTLTLDLGILISKIFLDIPLDIKRRIFFVGSGASVAALAIGVYQAQKGPYLKEVEIPIKDLPLEFQNFKIAQVSDLHVGPLIDKEFCAKVVNQINALDADIVCLTGDLVDGAIEHLSEHVAPLANLKSRYGNFYCTGNHEYYWGADGWIKHFSKMGIKPLLNESTYIEKNGSRIAIGGVPDFSVESIDPNQAPDAVKTFKDVDPKTIKILMAHQPKFFEEAHKAGVHLQLSGHTHAGQFFPFSLIVKFVHTYYRGLNLHDGMWVYVNQGTGYWGPPDRFLVPNEITLLKLVKA